MPSFLRRTLGRSFLGRPSLRALTLAAALACVIGLVGVAPATAAGLDLHRGSRGATVRTLEARLAQLRLLPASAVDGRYRTATVRAVKKFQRQHRVRATGRVNTRTWTLVARAVAPRPVSTPPPPAAPPAAPAPAPLILAHRGGVGPSAPENTLASMRLAASSADILEFDLQLTADGVFVLMHDSTLDRTTNCSGRISAWTLADLRAGCTVGGQPIPTFEEVTQFAAGTSTAIAPELKSLTLSNQNLASLVATVRANGMVDRTFVQSFRSEYFPRLRALERRLTFVYLAKSATAPATMLESGATVAGLSLVGLTATTVSTYVRAGMRVWAYTATTTDELRTAWNLRVNGVFTDLPAEARAMYHPAA